MSPIAENIKPHENTEIPKDGNANTLSKRRIIKNLVVVSLGTLFVLASDDIMITMQSTLNQDQGVGIASVAVQYAFTFLTSLFLPKYMVLRFGYKTNIKIFIIMFIPFLVANYYPLYYLMILSSISIGVGFSIFKGALDPYLNNLSRLYADLQIAELQEKETRASSKRSSSIEIYTTFKPDFKTITQNHFCTTDNGLTNENTLFNFMNVSSEQFNEHSSSNYSTMEKCTFSGECYHLDKDTVKAIQPEEINVATCSKEDKIQTIDERISKKRKINSLNRTNRIAIEDSVLKDKRKEDKSNILESTTIRFFGFHSMINMCSYVFSNVTSYFVLQNGYANDFVPLSAANETCFCGAYYCNIETVCSEHNLQQPSTANRNILISVCVGLWFVAGVVWVVFLDDLKRDRNAVSFSADTFLATFRHMKKINQILLVPMTMNAGMVIGFYIGDYTKSYIACAWGIQFVGLVTTCTGVGMAIGCTLSGWLAKPMGRRPIFISAAILNATLIAILLLWEPNSNYPAMFFVTALLFGSLYGIYYTQIRALYGVLFRDDEEAAFGAYQFWYSVGLCLSLSYSNFLCNYIKTYIFMLSCSLGLIGYLVVERSHSMMKMKATSPEKRLSHQN